MPALADQEFWCVCRKHCKGHRKPLNTANTWRRHLREASEDEKDAIRLAGRSDDFRAFLNAANGSNIPEVQVGVKRPADNDRCSTDHSHSPPRQWRCYVCLAYS